MIATAIADDVLSYGISKTFHNNHSLALNIEEIYFNGYTVIGSLKSEVQHPPSGKVHSCKSVRHTASFNLRSA
jgi:hypothetical protein